METRILRKTALLGAILLIGILIMGQSAMAARPETPSSTITEAFVDFETNLITIYGQNFVCDGVIVILGDYDPLTCTCSLDPDEIEAELPADIEDGDYLLTIKSKSPFFSDTYNLTIGAIGPTGPQGPQGKCDCPITQEELDDLIARIEYLENNAFMPRFTDMGDGTIRDNETGLLWLNNANAFGTMDWYDAMDEASKLSSGEHGLSDGSGDGDWRLPIKAEWEAFMSAVYDNPALVNSTGILQWSEGDAFTGVQAANLYWSSTEYDSSHAWHAHLRYGYMYYDDKVRTRYVWPVRSDN